LYLLTNRDFPAGTAASSEQQILAMKTNGQSYRSQLATDATINVRVVGEFDVSDPSRAFAVFSLHEIVPLGLSRADIEDIFDNLTFGWFEFSNGTKGAIVADFGTRLVAARSSAADAANEPMHASQPAAPHPDATATAEAPTLSSSSFPHKQVGILKLFGQRSFNRALDDILTLWPRDDQATPGGPHFDELELSARSFLLLAPCTTASELSTALQLLARLPCQNRTERDKKNGSMPFRVETDERRVV
jgi:hypothetical protein